MKVRFDKKFKRDTERITDRDNLRRIDDVIEKVEAAHTLYDVPGVKKLTNNPGFYRIRVGQHRIGVQYRDGDVWFLRFLPRSDIYREFP